MKGVKRVMRVATVTRVTTRVERLRRMKGVKRVTTVKRLTRVTIVTRRSLTSLIQQARKKPQGSIQLGKGKIKYQSGILPKDARVQGAQAVIRLL
ncbi:hypothetical protein FOWG_17979 [Fusarium oxysporum f. sp. lycopersici MN25]|nr:hypothetical protein FOWG_17979 [Fusarium oxysporum f. sp. lycopersici MN25]